MSHQAEFIALVKDAQTRIKEITVAELDNKLQATPDLVVIDVREENEWSLGHLPKAIHISKGVIERDIIQQIPNKNAEIILYCGGGYRSALAADTVQKMGYQNVWSLQGGFKAWYQAGLPIV